MIEKGGTSTAKFYLGNTEVKKIYKGDTLVYGSESPALPYDAEVEYLETDGTAYIDTGFIPNDIKPILETMIYKKSGITSSNYVVGSDGSGNTRFSIGFMSSNRIQLRIGSYKNFTYSTAQFYKVKIDSITGQGYIDDVLEWTGTKNAATSTHPILLFSSTDSTGAVRTPLVGTRIAWCKMWNDTTLIADYIPVRVGQVGYFYDKVTGALKGNAAASGAFVLGADVV